MNTIRFYKPIGCLFLFTFILASCSDFLDQQNPNTITIGNYWETEEDFEKGLMSVYNTLGDEFVLGSNTYNHLMSETTMPDPWAANAIDANNFIFTNINEIVVNKWQNLYRGVFRANQVLENLNSANLDAGFKRGVEAEARFLRGLYYFWLASCYNDGNIIIHTSIPVNNEDFHRGVSTRGEVYALIYDDLKFAQDNLPRTWNNQNLGRATWGAATGILGQAYIYEGEYALAQTEFKRIIDSDLYRLAANIGWNFDLENEHNSESIFEVNFSDAVKPGENNDNNHATRRAFENAPQEAGGNRRIEPSYYFIELCKTDPIDPANPINNGQTFSQRVLATICFKGDGQIFYQRPSTEFPFIVGQEAHIKKFQNWTWQQEPNTERSGINERVLRLADVYLMYAETVLRTTGNVDEALNYVNQVRERSAVLKLERSNYNAESLMTHIMRIERPLELAFEGHMIRFQDLKRWGIIQDVYDEISVIEYASTRDWLRVATSADANNPEVTLSKQYVTTASNLHLPSTVLYFPIPNVEVINNAEFAIP